MKTPFNAFFLPPSPSAALPTVAVRPCVVQTLFPSAQVAGIEVHSGQISGRVYRVVPFADLASTEEAAIAEAIRRIKLLPAMVEKSAMLQAAGTVAGKM